MKLGRFRLGMRTIKTAIAVMLCILLFHFLDRGQPLTVSYTHLTLPTDRIVCPARTGHLCHRFFRWHQ